MATETRLDDALLARLATDPHRPRYHFMPPAQWMNDPNGLIHWRGQYHLFYQHNPASAQHADMHWGHAVSADLVHWRHLPIALAPTPGGPDQDGVFSGCAVDDNGVPTIVYTGVHRPDQLVCLATAADPTDPDLVAWHKDPGNPVIPATPPGVEWVAYRDPSVWREEDGTWYMVHGAGIIGQGGAALLYRSTDLTTWEYLAPISIGDVERREPIWTGSMWECPQLFPLGDTHVLLIAAWFSDPPRPSTHHAAYAVGAFDGRRFVPTHEAILDVGVLYAPQTLRDDAGRRILWGWLREGRSKEAQVAAGWSGVMSLPWILTPPADGLIGVAPAPELASLRGAHTHLADLALDSDTPRPLGAEGDCLELAVEFAPGDAAEVGLSLRRSPDGAEETRILYAFASGRLTIDRSRSSADPSVDRIPHTALLPLAPAETLRLRVFLDRSVIEIFANERLTLTTRIYPTRADSLGIGLVASGGTAQVRTVDAWQLGTIWPDE